MVLETVFKRSVNVLMRNVRSEFCTLWGTDLYDVSAHALIQTRVPKCLHAHSILVGMRAFFLTIRVRTLFFFAAAFPSVYWLLSEFYVLEGIGECRGIRDRLWTVLNKTRRPREVRRNRGSRYIIYEYERPPLTHLVNQKSKQANFSPTSRSMIQTCHVLEVCCTLNVNEGLGNSGSTLYGSCEGGSTNESSNYSLVSSP